MSKLIYSTHPAVGFVPFNIHTNGSNVPTRLATSSLYAMPVKVKRQTKRQHELFAPGHQKHRDIGY